MTESQGTAGTDGGYPVRARWRSAIKPVVRSAIGVGIIAILVWKSDLEAIRRVLAQSESLYIALAVILMVGVLVVAGLRWNVFLRSLSIGLQQRAAIRLTFVGAFFNAFLPTGVGGDAYKAMRVRSQDASLSTTLASVLLDRISGIVSLAGIGLVAAALRIGAGDSEPVAAIAALVSGGAIVAASVLILFGARLVGEGTATWFGIRTRLRKIADGLGEAGRDPTALRWGILGGVAAQVFGIGAHLALARAVSLDLPIAALTLGVVLATIAASVPVTINGLGIRESVWVWILGTYGLGSGRALAFALLVLAMSLASSAIGGIVYAIMGGDVSPTTRGVA